MPQISDSLIFFSRTQVLEHNKKDDCWIIIRNNVFDLTDFISEHPGGSEILLARAGEDATSYFITKHGKNPGILRQLEKYKIGEVRQEEKITADDFSEPFLMELIDKCYAAKLYRQAVWYRNSIFWARALGVVSFFGLSFSALYLDFPWWLAIVCVGLQAIVSTSLFGLIAHESTHRDFPSHPVFKFLLRICWPVFWPFISQGPLKYEHNSHHLKIGDPEYDYEVAAFAPLVRYSGQVAFSFFHRYQHLMARYLYPFYANFITTVGGVFSGFWKRHKRLVKLEHAFSLVIAMSYYIVIPSMIYSSFWWFLTLYLVFQCVLFYGIYVGAAINHFVPGVTQPIPVEHSNHYGYYNCHNTTNFCTDNKFWYWYTGGFNIQIEHHLIPFIPVENLPQMIPIVKKLCSKYGYPYHNYHTFKQLWDDHYSYLKLLSKNEEDQAIQTEMSNKAGYQAR